VDVGGGQDPSSRRRAHPCQYRSAGLHPGSIADPGAFYERPDALGLFTLEHERDVSEQVDVAALTRMGGYGNKTKTAAYRLRVSRDRIDEEAPR